MDSREYMHMFAMDRKACRHLLVNLVIGGIYGHLEHLLVWAVSPCF